MEISYEDMLIINEVLKEYNQWYEFIDEEFRYITYPKVKEFKYVISNYSTIINLEKRIIMRQSESNGYLGLTLSKQEGGIFRVSVHRLVAWEFSYGYDEEASKTYVNHIDSCRINNHADNLEWCTAQENSIHGFNNDVTYSAKRDLSRSEVEEICQLFQDGYSMIEVYRKITGCQKKSDNIKMYKVINRIHTRTYYRNVSKNYEW